MSGSRSTTNRFDALRQAALAHPEVEESLACKGTAIESASFRVRGKAFLFLSPAKAMVKLDRSRVRASELEAQSPETCKTGAGGWTTVALSGPALPPLATLRAWIAESYDSFASTQAAKKTRRKS
jgi:hypothetical protein